MIGEKKNISVIKNLLRSGTVQLALIMNQSIQLSEEINISKYKILNEGRPQIRTWSVQRHELTDRKNLDKKRASSEKFMNLTL